MNNMNKQKQKEQENENDSGKIIDRNLSVRLRRLCLATIVLTATTGTLVVLDIAYHNELFQIVYAQQFNEFSKYPLPSPQQQQQIHDSGRITPHTNPGYIMSESTGSTVQSGYTGLPTTTTATTTTHTTQQTPFMNFLTILYHHQERV